jgi:hypothetical protein
MNFYIENLIKQKPDVVDNITFPAWVREKQCFIQIYVRDSKPARSNQISFTCLYVCRVGRVEKEWIMDWFKDFLLFMGIEETLSRWPVVKDSSRPPLKYEQKLYSSYCDSWCRKKLPFHNWQSWRHTVRLWTSKNKGRNVLVESNFIHL